MEFEQIVKRLEWLDDEHRKDKAALSQFEGRIASIEINIKTLREDIKDLGKKIAEIGPVNQRISQFDNSLSKLRADINESLETIDKKHQQREKEIVTNYQAGLEELKLALPPLDQSKDIEELRKLIKQRVDEDIKLNIAVAELKPKIDDSLRKSEDIAISVKLVEDSRRQDIKRVADMQGEITSIRKRVDEYRQKIELQNDTVRNVENRFTELLVSESERKKAQVAFIEQQSLAQIDRDRAYKEWVSKIENFKTQNDTIDTQTQALDETLRAAKRAQETYLELNQRLERRINEITEMQRLGEDRLRQEWVTFKAEDQKRWTGYTLSSEENIREIRKTVDKYEERITAVDDSSQVVQDLLHQTTDATEQQLQELMNVFHQWLTAYERIMGHVRKTTK